jgi:hypothetical protein
VPAAAGTTLGGTCLCGRTTRFPRSPGEPPWGGVGLQRRRETTAMGLLGGHADPIRRASGRPGCANAATIVSIAYP